MMAAQITELVCLDGLDHLPEGYEADSRTSAFSRNMLERWFTILVFSIKPINDNCEIND